MSFERGDIVIVTPDGYDIFDRGMGEEEFFGVVTEGKDGWSNVRCFSENSADRTFIMRDKQMRLVGRVEE